MGSGGIPGASVYHVHGEYESQSRESAVGSAPHAPKGAGRSPAAPNK